MTRTDTSEAKSSASYLGTSFAKEVWHKYTDYSLISGLSPRRGRRDFVSWVDMEFAETALDTPENRVYYINKKQEETEIKKRDENGEQILRSSEWQEQQEQTKQILRSSEWPGTNFILSLESTLIWVLARMENRGVAFDKTKLIDIGERIRIDIGKLETEIYDIIGERFNLNSPKQLQVILFEKLGIKPTKKNKTGYSVDNDVLEEIAKKYDIARLILEYRGLAKLLSTYVEWLLRSVGGDGYIHTTYDSLGAATGRMSSVDPNLQNIPTGDGYAREIKECFVPSEWSILLVADYSQIELRILSFLSQDDWLLDAFEHGEDIHARTAFFLFGDKVWWDQKTWKATSEQRRIAKSVNFGVIYGITGFWLAKTLDCSPWEAQEYVNAFYLKYPSVRTYYDNLLQGARVNGYVDTYFGRRRYIPGVNDANKTLRAMAEREAMNMPVQGTAADIIKIAMIDLDAKIRDMNLRGKMILQVHDELVFDIPLAEKEEFESIVRDIMEGVLRKYISKDAINERVPPIIVDISTGSNWSEAK